MLSKHELLRLLVWDLDARCQEVKLDLVSTALEVAAQVLAAPSPRSLVVEGSRCQGAVDVIWEQVLCPGSLEDSVLGFLPVLVLFGRGHCLHRALCMPDS